MRIHPTVRAVVAAAPFAPTSYSRLRLIRQLHASGLLRDGSGPVTARGERAGQNTGAGCDDTPSERGHDDGSGSGGC